MKLLKDLIKLNEAEMMKSEEFLKDAKEAAEEFKETISKEFGDEFTVLAKVSGNLGHALSFSFFNKEVKVTRHNSPVLIDLMMHLSNNSGKLVDTNNFEIELLTYAHELRNAGVKFRKIKGSTPTEATKKLIQWFKKNKDIIVKTLNENKKD